MSAVPELQRRLDDAQYCKAHADSETNVRYWIGVCDGLAQALAAIRSQENRTTNAFKEMKESDTRMGRPGSRFI